MNKKMEHWKVGKFDFKKCPDCGHDKFLIEFFPGNSVNFKCENCEAKFNDMGPFGVDRLDRIKKKNEGNPKK